MSVYTEPEPVEKFTCTHGQEKSLNMTRINCSMCALNYVGSASTVNFLATKREINFDWQGADAKKKKKKKQKGDDE